MGFLSAIFGKTDYTQLSAAIKEDAVLVDVRTADEFASGSVNGAINIPLDQLQSQFAKLRNKKHIVVFCRSGNRSSQAKNILETNNFQNVINGGTWQNVKKVVNG